jgi:vanillate/3-O-methylgallate O-demethylase
MSKELISYHRNVQPFYLPGWGGPQYTDWMDEQMSWKETCYIGDWSFLRELVFDGPDALKLFSDISVNSFSNFRLGQAKHVIHCGPTGKVIAQGILIRTGEQTFINQSISTFHAEFMLKQGGYDATCHERRTFNYQVSGPKALAVIETLTGSQAVRDIRFMNVGTIKIRGVEVRALRQGMAGEIGFELQGPEDCAGLVHDAVLTAGEAFGIRRLGHRTAMINHLEACYPTHAWHYLPDYHSTPGLLQFLQACGVYTPRLKGSQDGGDISDYYRSPYEMGWGRNVKFDHEFVGRAALEAEAANPRRSIVTLEFDNDDVADIAASLFAPGDPYEPLEYPHPEMWTAWNDDVVKDGAVVGVSTVPGYSFFYRRFLSLTYIDVALAVPGTKVEIVWGDPGKRQKRIRATVAPAPYKPHAGKGDLSRG